MFEDEVCDSVEVTEEAKVKTCPRDTRGNARELSFRLARVDLRCDCLATRAAEEFKDATSTECMCEHYGSHYASGGVTNLTVNAGFVDSCTFGSSKCPEGDEAKEATTVSDLNTEGEVIISHPI